jgi:hypothetical protein
MNIGEKMSDKKTLRKKAEKALKKAHKAVASHKGSKKSSKKREKHGADLQPTVKKAAKKAKAAALSQVAPDQQAVKRPVGTSASVVKSPQSAPRRGTPTVVELRQQAKVRQIAGYSRLNKAELIAALG